MGASVLSVGVCFENPSVDWHPPIRLQGEPERPAASKQGGHEETECLPPHIIPTKLGNVAKIAFPSVPPRALTNQLSMVHFMVLNWRW